VPRAGAFAVVLGSLALVTWWGGGVGYACDPVTGVGCDMNTPSPTAAPADSSPPPADPAPSGPAPAPPQPRGEPFIPPDQQQVPGAPLQPTPPSSSVTPEPPTGSDSSPPVDAPVSTSDESGGGGVPWKLGLLAPAVVLAGVGVGVLARKRRTPEEAITEYQRTCAHLCWAKGAEAQAEQDVAAAEAQLEEIDVAWKRARDYLTNQLRDEYLTHKRNRAYGYAAAIAGGGPFLWVGGGPVEAYWHSLFGSKVFEAFRGSKAWNAEVNEELATAYGEIDRMRNEAVARWTGKLEEAKRIQRETFDARHDADSRLSYLRGYHPDVTFPECVC
jgi:hypothetical protein